MESKAKYFLNSLLGNDFFDLLKKTEIYKPGSRSTVDTSDIHLGLKLVPRVLMQLLVKEFGSMKVGETKEIVIPMRAETMLRATKMERDSVSGEIFQENKKIAEFLNRSIPGCGLVLLSALELYDLDELDSPSEEPAPDLQKLIDDRMALHRLVDSVVDGKLQQRDAISQLILSKLTDAIQASKTEQAPAAPQAIVIAPTNKEPVSELSKKSLPLKEFLEKRKDKKKPKEFKIELAKGENVHCPDCGKNIFDGKLFSGCICLGENMDSKVFIKKSESGIKVRFSKGWDQDNIELLLEVLRSKKNG